MKFTCLKNIIVFAQTVAVQNKIIIYFFRGFVATFREKSWAAFVFRLSDFCKIVGHLAILLVPTYCKSRQVPIIQIVNICGKINFFVLFVFIVAVLVTNNCFLFGDVVGQR